MGSICIHPETAVVTAGSHVESFVHRCPCGHSQQARSSHLLINVTFRPVKFQKKSSPGDFTDLSRRFLRVEPLRSLPGGLRNSYTENAVSNSDDGLQRGKEAESTSSENQRYPPSVPGGKQKQEQDPKNVAESAFKRAAAYKKLKTLGSSSTAQSGQSSSPPNLPETNLPEIENIKGQTIQSRLQPTNSLGSAPSESSTPTPPGSSSSIPNVGSEREDGNESQDGDNVDVGMLSNLEDGPAPSAVPSKGKVEPISLEAFERAKAYKQQQAEMIAAVRGSLDEVATKATTLAGEGLASANIAGENSEVSGGISREATIGEPGNFEFPNKGADQCGLLDERFLRRVAVSEDADAVLALIAERLPEKGGIISREDCSQMILAAIAQHNAELAFSILDSMRSSLLQRRIDGQEDADGGGRSWGWGWPQPDVTTYAVLARGLAASLRVSDAIRIVGDVRRRGIPQGDEVPFGKLVNCPTCKTSLAVVQPQHGIQLVPCATCRYQYELMSGVIVSSQSESISSDASFWERGLQMLPFLNRRIPAAIHSVVVRAPDGLAQTHRFATQSADVPAQQGERVTMVLASPENVGRGIGPIRFNARAPGWKPREPMAVTNHITGQVLSLMRAPPKAGSRAAIDTSAIVPIAILLASTDAAAGLVDPSLPRLIAVGAVAAVTFGGAVNTFLLPQLNQLPQRTVDAIALRQRLLAQYEQLQTRLQELTEAASNEVRMLARMCQLQNKMEAVGEASYGARIGRVQKAREGLDERIAARLELLDSYAKVASMIEIEVEMDIDVLAAEAASPEATIAEQIERLMEVESLQKEWKDQAEANDELERLLRTAPFVPDSA